MSRESQTPLSATKVVVIADGVAAAYAARMLGTMGADVLLVEPTEGSPLRHEPPFLPDAQGQASEHSALFAYLTAGMRNIRLDMREAAGQAEFLEHLVQADIFIDDTPVSRRILRSDISSPSQTTSSIAKDGQGQTCSEGQKVGWDHASLSAAYPSLIVTSVLPFGAYGSKADWQGDDLIIQHAGGEGNLLPNGLAVEMFPDRPPLKIGGHFGAMQGGIAAALGALSALWDRPQAGGQCVDVSSQDAMLAVGAFAIQRLGDGSIEHRVERSFRYGGVIPCADGYLELLTLEQRQWEGLVKLLGEPEWALDPALESNIERSRQGPEINARIREWASTRRVNDIVDAGQKLGVPLARYNTPAEILTGAQEQHRGLFQAVDCQDLGALDMLVSPFHFTGAPLAIRSGPPLGKNSSADAVPLTADVEG